MHMDLEYTLRDITDELCEESNEVLDEQLIQTRYEGYHKNFLEFFRDIMDLKEEIESLKENNGYRFKTKEDIIFIKNILREYSKAPMAALRRADLEQAGDEFIVNICYGVRRLFDKPEIPKKVLTSVMDKLNIRFEYMSRERRTLIKSLPKRTLEVWDKYNSLTDYERDVWLYHFVIFYKELLSKWENILAYMAEIRREEISDSQDRALERQRGGKCVTEEDIELEVTKRCNEDKQYRELMSKYENICKLNNNPVLPDRKSSKDSRLSGEEMQDKSVKKPFFSKVLKQVGDIQESMNQIEEKIRAEVLNYFSSYQLDVDDTPFMSPEELLKKALTRYNTKYKNEQ